MVLHAWKAMPSYLSSMLQTKRLTTLLGTSENAIFMAGPTALHAFP